jgi:ABC-type Fe3+/spermidine/putrescine transport system ATPase subunit
MSAVPGDYVALRDISKNYGSFRALDRVSLTVGKGSFLSLLGPSGCGKTTALRVTAGFLEADAGSVTIAGRDQAGLSPDKRGVGLVFQDYALFPHLSVRENLSYGLKLRRSKPEARLRRVSELAEALDLGALLERYPHELSGGQQQRVALGRALALEPELLLMDEPLSNLDAKLRARVREEIKALQARLGITTIYVTHDQEEAFTLSDRVAIMEAGRLLQVDEPQALYRSPASRFVADFVGSANFVEAAALQAGATDVVARISGPMAQGLGQGTVRARRPSSGPQPLSQQAGVLMIRPEWLSLLDVDPGTGIDSASGIGFGSGSRADANALWFLARVRSLEFYGNRARYWLSAEGSDFLWMVDESLSAASSLRSPGSAVFVILKDGEPWWVPA